MGDNGNAPCEGCGGDCNGVTTSPPQQVGEEIFIRSRNSAQPPKRRSSSSSDSDSSAGDEGSGVDAFITSMFAAARRAAESPPSILSQSPQILAKIASAKATVAGQRSQASETVNRCVGAALAQRVEAAIRNGDRQVIGYIDGGGCSESCREYLLSNAALLFGVGTVVVCEKIDEKPVAEAEAESAAAAVLNQSCYFVGIYWA